MLKVSALLLVPVALLAVPGPPPTKEPSARRLDFLVGRWRQTNRFLGGDFKPGTGGSGEMTCRWGVGDAWLVSESRLDTPDRGAYEVLNVVGVTPGSEKYRAYSFNSLGLAVEYAGEWQDEATLVFTATGAPAGRRSRVVYTRSPDGTVLFRAERAAGDGPFEAYFESTLSR